MSKYLRGGTTSTAKNITTDVLQFVYYDPDLVNAAVTKGSIGIPKQFAPKVINRAMYDRYMYQLFVLQFISYFDNDRDTKTRNRISAIIKNVDFKKPGALNKFNSELSALVPDSADRSIIMNSVNNYFYVHFDKTRLIDDINSHHYQFDRVIINRIAALTAATDIEGTNRDKIYNLVKGVVGKITKAGTPTTHDKETFNVLSSCVSSKKPYCKSKKLVLPASKIKDFTEILTSDLMNPLKNIYIMSSIFVEGIIDYFKFDKVPGEDVYVKF
jgi:hypothetical protein